MASMMDVQARLTNGDYQCIKTDRGTSKRIATAFINKGWWFVCFHQEDDYYIAMSNAVDLKWFSNRRYNIELET